MYNVPYLSTFRNNTASKVDESISYSTITHTTPLSTNQRLSATSEYGTLYHRSEGNWFTLYLSMFANMSVPDSIRMCRALTRNLASLWQSKVI